MHVQDINEYKNNANSLFNSNHIEVIGRTRTDMSVAAVHMHQVYCYNRLTNFLREHVKCFLILGKIPDLTLNQSHFFSSSIPILSFDILTSFENFFSKANERDKQLIVSIIFDAFEKFSITAFPSLPRGFIIPKSTMETVLAPLFHFEANSSIHTIETDEIRDASTKATAAGLIPNILLEDARHEELFSRLDSKLNTQEQDIATILKSQSKLSKQAKDELQKLVNKTLDEQTDQAIQKIYDVQETSIKEIDALSKTTKNQFSDRVKDVEEQVAGIKASTDAIVEDVESRTKEIIESVASGFTTEGALKAAFDLWGEKEALHRKMFYIGIGVFFGAIAALLLLGWIFSDNILSFENNIFASPLVPSGAETTENIAHIISRILFITLPVGVIIWVLRAILRWANLNLALAEDAAQRSIMAQTYVNLLKNGDVTEDKDDRKVMLEAIFRPLPGIQEMDTAPPSIINFANPNAKT